MLFDPFRIRIRGHDVLVIPPYDGISCEILRVTNTIRAETPWTGFNIIDDGPDDLQYTRYIINRYRREPELVMFCVIFDGMYVGKFTYHKGSVFREQNKATLSAELLQDYTGMGIASIILPKIFAHAKAHGVEIMCLSVVSTNERAMKLYTRFGFFECGRVPGGYRYRDRFGSICYADDVFMVKYLL